MKRIFIETNSFRKKIDGIANSELLIHVQNEILKNPKSGTIIKGTGGIRKIRIKDPFNKIGKRSAYRIIYFDFEEIEKTYLLWIYTKNEKDDISVKEKKIINKLVQKLKQEAKA